jgi:hypothetical protein
VSSASLRFFLKFTRGRLAGSLRAVCLLIGPPSQAVTRHPSAQVAGDNSQNSQGISGSMSSYTILNNSHFLALQQYSVET